MDEEEIKMNKDDGVARFFTRFGGFLYIFFFKSILFVDLWEAQPCLRDPE